MGNSQSAGNHSHTAPVHNFGRKRSGVFSRLSLGCASDSSTFSFDPSQETSSLVNEKSALRERHNSNDETRHAMPSPAPVAYAPTIDMIPDDTVTAYNSFLHDYPGAYRISGTRVVS